MFVVDDLVGWLIGRLAEAGYQKLTTLVRGSPQERALKQAVKSAVQATADEISPTDKERAGQLAELISGAFGKPPPATLLPRKLTRLEGLYAGTAQQLSVLDEGGQPPAGLLGVAVSVVAHSLTDHLVEEITNRGAEGGALTPLADQLNHDLTHLQGDEVKGMLAQLLGEVRDALAAPASAVGPVGWPLAEVRDPFALEVHRPVQPEDPPPGLPVLPAYVPRDHDAELGLVVRAAADGSSEIAVLVGGSSTGKTRACWEALGLLRDRPGPWRLWHPIDPSRPEAALRELPAVGPRTVVWLNEAQLYLDVADGGLGERVAAGLRELLRDPARAPVLVLATLWPEYWHGLTARPAGGADTHAQARELLDGHDITVPAAFTAAQLQQLSQAGDARLVQAAGAQDGQVIQFLAGAPELLARYRNAPPAAAALIHTAMDARRLGMGIALSRAFLEAAAPGYLTDTEWDALDDDWLEQVLDYTAEIAKGVRGPLTRIRPRPARSGAAGCGSRDSDEQLADGQAGTPGGPLYRLADYLDQHGRIHRKGQIPPAGFWAAAADYAFPREQAALGTAAHARGLYQAAAQLHKNAARRGNRNAVFYLVPPPPCLRGDVRPLYWVAAHASLDDPGAVAGLLGLLREAGAQDQVTALADRAAAHVSLDDSGAVARLLHSLRVTGAQDQFIALADRAAAHVSLDDPGAVAGLLGLLREAGAQDQVTALADRAAAYASLDDPGAVARLLDWLRVTGAQDQFIALADRAAAHASLENPSAVPRLLGSLRAAGTPEQVSALADRAAAHASLKNPGAVARLLDWLRVAGTPEQVSALADRAAAHASLWRRDGVAGLLNSLREAGAQDQFTALANRAAHASLDDPFDVTLMLDSLREAGAQDQFTALANRAAHASLENPDAVTRLLGSLRTAGAPEQVTALADRVAAHASVENPGGVAGLLDGLREAGAQDQVTALADRVAAHASVENPGGVAGLLDGLREAGAQDQVTALADRAAAHASLDDPGGVARLLDSLRTAGAPEQVTALLHRNPAAHASLDDPGGVARLLDSLRTAGAPEQVTALLHRNPAAHASLDDPRGVANLLDGLREADAPEQVTALADRLPGAGMFELFRGQRDPKDQFRFGREADGSPAKPWGWDDLD